ncbi:MAG TPA: radical SAM protein [Candidatus Glassbacteria bacterium]|nr:radical SAM protein [Candidatus Glassbacteria bacterium]
MNKLNIQSIFNSIDGEFNCFDGAGQLTTFIRLKGCNLECSYCDTTYSQSSTPENWMTIDEILEQVHFKKVTITGGEPLLQKEAVEELCGQLLFTKHSVTKQISIETNGSIQPIYTWPSIRYIVDYKLPSSGMNKRMKDEVFQDLRQTDAIKFVIADWVDYNRAVHIIESRPEWKARKVFSPALNPPSTCEHCEPICGPNVNMDWPRQLVEKMIQDKVDASFSLQLHKILWPGATEER